LFSIAAAVAREIHFAGADFQACAEFTVFGLPCAGFEVLGTDGHTIPLLDETGNSFRVFAPHTDLNPSGRQVFALRVLAVADRHAE
jgi:hypothetical protein